jgi:HSP20 family protein
MFNLIPWKKRGGNVAVRRDASLGDWQYQWDRDVHPLARLREEFDTLLTRFFDDRWWEDRFGPSNLLSESHPGWNWDLGWEDKENEYVFQAELPGFEPEDFEVKVSGNVLMVRAEHKDEKQDKDGGSSYHYGSFSRSVTLPRGVDSQKIDARYHSGVLELHLPKTEEARGKRIEVKAE